MIKMQKLLFDGRSYMEGQFVFYLKAQDEDRLIQFPIPPSEMKTALGGRNTTIETVGMGEVNIIKDIGLRDISFEVLLPQDLSLPFVQQSIDGGVVGKPIFYLSWLREVMSRKVPLKLIISRRLPGGIMSFPGNMNVCLEGYTVIEKGGCVGDYIVEIKLKEYRRR